MTSDNVPERGDVVWLDYDADPAGHEQGGRRPALTLSSVAYNRTVGLALFCPLTHQVKGYPFEVAVPSGSAATGVILADQVKSLDWRERQADFLCKLEAETVNEAVGKTLALLDPDGVFGGFEAPPGD